MRALLAFAILGAALLAGCTNEQPAVPAPPQPITGETLTLDTSAGRIVIWLYPDAAPATVAYMRDLVAKHYYDGRYFLRTVPGHVIQVADRTCFTDLSPTTRGACNEDNRTIPLEVADARYHFSAGAVGIARGADPASGGPEFFIMDFATSHLDGNYTVFGQVVSGMDVVHKIARVDAIEAPRLPTVPGVPPEAQVGLPFDRMAILPVNITAAAIATATLPGPVAATLPVKVATNARYGDYRHSLEWPADLHAGTASRLTWYVRASNGQPVPDAAHVAIAADGATMQVTPDANAPGAYSFAWVPDTPGTHGLELRVDGVAWATLGASVA